MVMRLIQAMQCRMLLAAIVDWASSPGLARLAKRYYPAYAAASKLISGRVLNTQGLQL